MNIDKLDVVELKDGRTGTILEVYESSKVFLVEIADEKGKTVDMPIVKLDDIKCVKWANS